MGNGLILLLLLITLLLFSGVFYFLSFRRNKKYALLIEPDFKKFESAIADNDIERIVNLGINLIYNPKLLPEQLEKMNLMIGPLLSQHPIEMKKLDEAILNKKLHWNRALPW